MKYAVAFIDVVALIPPLEGKAAHPYVYRSTSFIFERCWIEAFAL